MNGVGGIEVVDRRFDEDIVYGMRIPAFCELLMGVEGDGGDEVAARLTVPFRFRGLTTSLYMVGKPSAKSDPGCKQ